MLRLLRMVTRLGALAALMAAIVAMAPGMPTLLEAIVKIFPSATPRSVIHFV